MATQCMASSKVALPSFLRRVFQSEFNSCHGPRSSLNLHGSRSSKQLPRRPFSSSVRIRQLQITPSPEIIATSAPSSSAPQPSPPATTSSPAAGLSSSPSTIAESPSDRSGRVGHKSGSTKGRAGNQSKSVPKVMLKAEPWRIQKDALEKKFPQGWNPPKRLSPDALEGIRHLHATAPEQFTTAVLAEEFKVSPEAIRRILKSRWRPSETEAETRRKRWEKRHERIWSRMAELGLRPSTKASRPYSDANTLYKPGEREF
ncbi:hypothetical protein PDE_03231 [Penicillium oxalicum 114-2]|uniref:Required for respiratory growth protein 9, mitochondrial n=1 Tax=Penicillium oxalicum (strain 114-2 / CGMCC 5302) TaxID=933388 RepID=S7ZCD4_PENO1|nr:hypothetical protein PDE_03231 [Penicillium oxalicum 114-2]